jgi:uncharacterized protein YndB with AHSA1/START domain
MINTEQKEVRISYEINAPRDLVYAAWTDPEHLKNWYAPDGCSIKISRFELKENGVFLHCIIIPDGKECWCKGVFLKVKKPEQLIYSMVVSDENGNSVDPASIGMDKDWPAETTVTVNFIERDGKTLIDLQQTVSESLAKRTGAYPSWLLMLARLENLIKK